MNQLWKVIYEDKKGGYKLNCYADIIVFDKSDQIKPKLMAIRFGGDPEMVRGLSDAIYGGGSVEIESIITLDSLTKQYQRHISNDGVYAESTLIVQDDAISLRAHEKYAQEQIKMEDPPRRCYIFCPPNDKERLFEEIDKRTRVPLIPSFQDYLLADLQKRGILRKLEVLTRTEKFDAWMLHCTTGDKNIIKSVEDGLKDGTIFIPGATQENAVAFDDIKSVTGYLQKFGTNIAERIKNQFVPIFDPTIEPLSREILAVNDNIRQKAGYPLYDAQLAAAEGIKRKLDQQAPGLLIAECGSGKTKIGLTALVASHLAQGKTKTFNVVLCPSHITEKWVREVEETVPNAFAGIITDVNELIKFYQAYQNDGRTAFAILSKERARDGYMRYPAVCWNKRIKAFQCPHCQKPIMMALTEDRIKYEVPADPQFFLVENTQNHKCKECGTILWAPLCKPLMSVQKLFSGIHPPCEWTKIGNFGFVHRNFLWQYRDRTRSPQILDALDEIDLNPTGNVLAKGAYRRYPLSSYIKKKMKGKIDGLIADEVHQYAQDSGQGDAMAEIAGTAKKVVGMTATLINGYASGIFFLLFRFLPKFMTVDGQEFRDPRRFCHEYGVMKSTYELRAAEYNANRRSSRTKKGEKTLPGVSPLVYSRFLLQNSVFLSLVDMGKDLPEYEEIPMALDMRPEVKNQYSTLLDQFLYLIHHEKGMTKKLLSAYLNVLTVYPDQPYGHPPVLDKDGLVLVAPEDVLTPDVLHVKDLKTLEIVHSKVQKGEKVLIYTSWVRIDTQEKLLKALTERGYHTVVLTTSIIPSMREKWMTEQIAGGLDVLICNSTLVETGLDLNAFTTLIFYNINFNLFTLRQASRRSWRINQTAPRIEVYFFYYKDSIQEKAMSLMASKLSVAGIIEGNITDEGLSAMSNCQDMTSQLAKELMLGIKNEVEDISAAFKKMAFLHEHSESVPEVLPPYKELALTPKLPEIVLADNNVDINYTLFVRSNKRIFIEPDESQLSFFTQIPA